MENERTGVRIQPDRSPPLVRDVSHSVDISKNEEDVGDASILRMVMSILMIIPIIGQRSNDSKAGKKRST
jgi:hypothetical protein